MNVDIWLNILLLSKSVSRLAVAEKQCKKVSKSARTNTSRLCWALAVKIAINYEKYVCHFHTPLHHSSCQPNPTTKGSKSMR